MSKIILWLAIIVFVANIVYIWQSPAMRNSVMGNDEYFFYRTTMNLPNYETTGAWMYDEKAPARPADDEYTGYLFGIAYTRPVWIHPLIPNYIAYPVAMLFTDVAQQIQWLRLFDILLITATFILFLDIIRRRTNNYIAAASVLPMLVGRYLLANGIMFYNDLFMWFFFALTLWTIEHKPHSRWIYVLTIITVLTKMNALLLLVPIYLYLRYKQGTIKNRVAIFAVGSYLAFMITQAILAKDVLYFYHHWGTLQPNAQLNTIKNVLPYLWDYAYSWGLWLSVPSILIGIAVILWRKRTAWYPLAAFAFVVMLYGFAWGSYAYHVYPVMYASMFMLPAIFFSENKNVQLA